MQALSLYRDASDLCRRALKRRPISSDDDEYFNDTASLVMGRAKTIEETLAATVERHLLAKNGLTTRYFAIDNGGGSNGNGGEWLRSVLTRCSEPQTGRADHEDVLRTETALTSSSSSSSLTVTG